MSPLRAVKASAWTLYGLGIAAGGHDLASWWALGESGFPNLLLMVAAVLGGNAAWPVGDVLAQHSAELAALRESLSRPRA